jgi:hypothetical protein
MPGSAHKTLHFRALFRFCTVSAQGCAKAGQHDTTVNRHPVSIHQHAIALLSGLFFSIQGLVERKAHQLYKQRL